MKKFFTLLVLMTLSVCAFAEGSSDSDPSFVVNNIAYRIISGTTNVKICKYSLESNHYKSAYTGDFVIPSSVAYGGVTYTVTGIGHEAFEESGITSLSIPETVTFIETDAFDECEKLTTLHFGKNLVSIGIREGHKTDQYDIYAVFNRCTALTSITVDAGNPAFADIDGVLASKDKSTLYVYPAGKQGTDYTTPAGVNTLVERVFNRCLYLENIVVSDDVTTIDLESNDGTIVKSCKKLKTLTLGANVPAEAIVAIMNNISYEYPYQVIVSDKNKNLVVENGVTYNKDKTTILSVGGLTATEFTTPAGVTTISANFGVCENLKTLIIGDDVTTIDGELYAPNLETLILGNGLTTLREGFWLGENLKKLVLGNGLTEIPNDCFNELRNLEELVFSSNIKTIGRHVFMRLGLKELVIPESVTSIGEQSFCDMEKVEKLTIGSNVVTIEMGCFNNCMQLKDIYNLAKTPQVLNSSFEGPVRYEGTLHVQAGCKAAYEVAPVWQEFRNIVEIDGTESKKGDANGDGEVNVADVDYVIERIGEALDATNKAADVNDDGEINVADVDYIIERIV